MDQAIKNYIVAQPADRQSILSAIHSIILDKDKTVAAEIAAMMGKEMIMYNCKGMMKYALAGVKAHMSLHVLPMYVSKPIFDKHQVLLSKAKFQKGCINFNTADQMPVEAVGNLITDCAKIDLVKMRADQLKEKKSKAKAKA